MILYIHIKFCILVVSDLDDFGNIIHCKWRMYIRNRQTTTTHLCILVCENVVAFGELNTVNRANILRFYVNSIHNNDAIAVCQLFGCTTCTSPIMIGSRTSILSADTLYSVERGVLVASAVFIDSLTQSSDYTLVLMLDPQANHPFVYHAASIDFIGDHLQALHSNDISIMRITTTVSNTEIRKAPSQGVNINGFVVLHGEEIIFLLNADETMTLSVQ